MKKSLLLIFSLLIFVGNVWGDYTCTLATSEVTVSGGGGSNTLSLGNTFKVVSLSIKIRSYDTGYTNSFDIGTTSGGNDLWNEACNWKSYPSTPTVQKDYSSAKSISAIYFKNNTWSTWFSHSKDRYYKDVKFTIETTELTSLGKVEANKSSKNTTCNVLAASKPGKSDFTFYNGNSQITDGSLSISSVTGSGYSYTITILFSPKEVKEYNNISIKFNGGIVATVSGEGTLGAPTNLKVSGEYTVAGKDTIVGYNKATLSWDAAGGAESYNIYHGNNLIAQTLDNSTSLDVNALQLGTTYSGVVVKAVKNSTESAGSNSIKFTTKDLSAPEKVEADQTKTSYSSAPLTWSQVDNATGYRIEVYNATNNKLFTTVSVDGVSTTSYVVTALEMNTSYTFTVYPTYNGMRSKKSKTSNAVVTKNMDISLNDCMIFENTEEIEFFMSAGEYYYPDDNGYVISDSRRAYTQKLTFDIKKALGYVGSVYDVRLYIKVGNNWQSSYIWNGNDFWDTGNMAATDYKTVTVTLPKNVTAVRFRSSQYTVDWQWDKYGGNKRYIKNVRVYMGAEAIATPAELDYEVYIGQKNTDDNTKTFNLKYANKVTDGARFDIDNKKFSGTFPTINSCTIGNEKDIPVSFYTEELNSNGEQGSLTIVTGDVASVSLNATVKALPAPKDLEANATGKSSVTLTWEENPGIDNRALGLASGYYVRTKKHTDNVYGDPVFVKRNDDNSRSYTCEVSELEDGGEYDFKVTTIYTNSSNVNIENDYAEIISKRTYASLTVLKDSEYKDAIGYEIEGEDGKWNSTEKSFLIGSKATIKANCSNSCAVFDKILVGESELQNPAEITINAPTTATIYYKFKGFVKPEVSVSENTSAYSIRIGWKEVGCASSYTVYMNGEAVATNVTNTYYTFNSLTPATTYNFKVAAVNGNNTSESETVSATTYALLTVGKDGDYAGAITYEVSGETGKWNNTEVSFAKDSKATITANCSNTCATFDKILIGETEYTENPAEITMSESLTARISYKFAGLEKPTVVVSKNNSKDKISISWNSVDCAESYTVYNGDKEVATGIITATEYKFENLTPATEYQFKVKAVNGDKSAESDAVSATTYTTSMNVEIVGIFGSDDVRYSISSTAMNDGEKSYAIGSIATVGISQLPENCVVDKIEANDEDISTTANFTVAAVNNVRITYRYSGSGIAEVINDKVYDTLNEAVEAVYDGGTINLLGDVPTQDLSVSGKHIEFNGNGHSISNLYIESDGSVDLIGDVVVVNDFGLEISTSNSGQFTKTNAEIIVNGRAYVDKILDNSGVGDYNKWYSVAVPFPVSIANGIYILDNNGNEIKKAVLNKDYAIFEYDSELRAKGTSRLPEWKLAATENMKLGTFYLLGLGYSGPNVYRFYKLDDADLFTAENQLEIKSYPASNPKNAGWNGIGNTKLFHIGIESPANNYAQVLEGNKFITVSLEDSKFAVTTPMFIQSDENTIATLSPKHNGSLRSVSASSDTYNLRIAKENADGYADQMFVSASDNVMEQYTIGKDLSKFEVSTLYPQIYTMAYGTALSVHEAAYNDKNIAEMPLYMFAPEAGNYTLSLGKDVLDGTALYLVKDGAEIHNFSNDGAYTLYLAKGTTSTYSLRISAATSDVPTIVEDENGSEIKIYVKEGVLVIEGLGIGESYNVGNMVRTLYYGVSNGGNITVPLSEQGVYWVKTGNKVVKVLNK